MSKLYEKDCLYCSDIFAFASDRDETVFIFYYVANYIFLIFAILLHCFFEGKHS